MCKVHISKRSVNIYYKITKTKSKYLQFDSHDIKQYLPNHYTMDQSYYSILNKII